MKLLKSAIIFLSLWTGSKSANILLVSTLISHSHHFWNEPVALGLATAGHNVTMISLDNSNVKQANFSLIHIKGIYEMFESVYQEDQLKGLTFSKHNMFYIINLYWFLLSKLCEEIFNSKDFQKFLADYPQGYKFDLILYDLISGECMYPIIERFGNPPVVGLSAYGLNPHIEEIFGATTYTQIPITQMPYTKDLTLWQRIEKVVYHLYFNYVRDTYVLERGAAVGRAIDPDFSPQKLKDIEMNFDLMLINWNPVVNIPHSLPPNIVPIGGIQIKPPKKLPKELQEVYEKPSKGIIFFALGSNIRSEVLGRDFVKSFTDCFEELSDYQVLWKVQISKDLDVKIPENVLTQRWLPQTDILAQEKTKLFITHGGGLSTQETVYFGVPTLGVPISLDQFQNVQTLSDKGGGRFIDYERINSKYVCDNIKAILYEPNQRYHKVMKDVSSKYRDVPMKPVDTAVFWIEHILRHGNGKHLSPVTRHLSYMQTQNLDIYLCALLALSMPLFVISALVKCIFCNRKKVLSSSNKKRN